MNLNFVLTKEFDRQNIFRTESGVDLKGIIQQMSSRIEDAFSHLNIEVKPNPSQKTITVSFEKMEQNDKNARNLIDMVEFVKTMVLALA